MSDDYLEIAAKKRRQQLAAIPSEWLLDPVPSPESAKDAVAHLRTSGLLSQSELQITEETDATVLLGQLARKEVSATEVIRAFAKRAALAHQMVNCCTEIFFEDAFEQAKQLDEAMEATGKPVGPLHGLPISLKDSVSVKGHDTTIGWTGLAFNPSDKDSPLATALRRLGAVLYVKTNIPQSLMMSDSFNHLFGQCVNPLHRELISGGSSGGESSLLAARGSIVGIGTDIGGSIRIPAVLCGLYGLSTSSRRHPYERGGAKQHMVRSVAGPMTTSISTIEAYMQALPEARSWETDPLVSPIPWRTEACTIPSSKKLKIGVVIDDGMVRPQPPILRAMEELVASLRAAGHEVTEWDASSHSYGHDLWRKAILSDGGLGFRKLCGMTGEPLIEGMVVGTDEDILSTEELHELHSAKHAFEIEYLERWNEAGVDALLMPVTPWVGYRPGEWVKSNQYLGYTSLWNLLDWAALAVPLGAASKEKDQGYYKEWNERQTRSVADEFNKTQFDPDLVEGVPLGIQVVCGKFEDEKCIAVAKIIESITKQQQQ